MKKGIDKEKFDTVVFYPPKELKVKDKLLDIAEVHSFRNTNKVLSRSKAATYCIERVHGNLTKKS